MSVIVSLQSKACTQCEEVKLFDSFHLYSTRCKACVKEYGAKHRAASLEKEKERKAKESVSGFDGVRECNQCKSVKHLVTYYEFRHSKTCLDCVLKNKLYVDLIRTQYRETPDKKCSQCNETKNKANFYRRAVNKSDGCDSQCKACRNSHKSYLIDETGQYQPTPELSQSALKKFEAIIETRERNGIVYILRDAANKALKIGFTIKLNNRLKQHQTSNPFLTLVNTISNVTISLESNIHNKLIFHRILGTTEWYRDDPQVLALFEDYKIKCKLESELLV